MGKGCSVDKDFLWETALGAFEELCREKDETSVLLDGEGLRSLHKSIRQRVIAKAFNEIGLTEDLTFAHYAKCEEIIFHEHPSARTDLPKGYCLAKNYDDIKVFLPVRKSEVRCLRIRMMSLEDYNLQNLDKNSHAVFDAEQMEAAYGADYAGRILYDDKGVEVFGFGKHKGRSVAAVFREEPSYYSWMMNGDFPLYTKKVITEIRLRDKNEK
jgi:hypothetical protein